MLLFRPNKLPNSYCVPLGSINTKHVICFEYFRVSEVYVDNPGDSDSRIPVSITVELPNLKCECKYFYVLFSLLKYCKLKVLYDI